MGMDIVTVTPHVASKGSPGSVVGLQGDNSGILWELKEVKVYPFILVYQNFLIIALRFIVSSSCP
jgi:hypothetical protein